MSSSSGLWMSGCQNAPFTSCLDDTTPCEVSDNSEDLDSTHTSSAAEGSNEGAPSNATLHTSGNTGSITASTPSNLPNSSWLGRDAMVSASPALDGSIVSEPDASVDVTLDESHATSEPPSASSNDGDAGATSELASATSEEETTEVVLTGDSVIPNGDFGAGIEGWKIEHTSGRGELMMADDGTLCVQSRGNVEFTIGWPAEAGDSANLASGRYQLSFRFQGAEAEMSVKVGHAYEPYDALHEVMWTEANEAWKQQVSTFMTRGDDATGLAFFVRLNGGSVCLDDVQLSPILDAESAD